MEKIEKNWEPIDFASYFSFVKWFLVLMIVIELVFRFWSSGFDGGIIANQRENIIWFLRVCFFVFLGWRAGKVFEAHPAIGAISGSIAGFFMGLVSALWRFFDGFKVWKFFNLLTETFLLLLVGAVISALAVYVFNFKKVKNN